MEIQKLRSQLRRQRRGLSSFEQHQAERAVFHKLRHFPKFKRAQKIGVYLHAFGEIRTDLIIQLCFSQHKHVYLPMICNMNQHLVWVKISKHQYDNHRFSLHRLGMAQAMQSRGHSVQHLDLLLMPLLACDAVGSRVGMGGGFYDRTLSRAQQIPYRLGLAHEFQYIDEILVRQAWDQPLNALVTPAKFRYFR